jgi:signal transduction histidine kinase
MEDADGILAEARHQADAVLRLARARADDELDTARATKGTRRQVLRQRQHHDDTLREERATADHKLEAQRKVRKLALTDLLAIERGHTDERLLFERAASDNAVRNRDDFLAVVAHDLRSHLAAVEMTVSYLISRKAAANTGEVADAGKLIQRAIRHMSALTSDLVDLVSIEVGHLKVQADDHEVGSMVDEVMGTFQGLAAKKSISMTPKIGKDLPLVSLDRDRILQVLSNLVGNAIKFTGEGGHISVGAEQTGPDVQFSVADDGCGIPEGIRGKIFERFTQGDRKNRQGLGLGLYIARSIVESHGGGISFESTEGAGTLVRFTLPATGSTADVVQT